MIKYIATRPFSYATRRLLPGDEFEAKRAHGRLLVAVKKARVKRDPGKIAAPAKAVTEKVMPQAVEEAPAVVEPIEVTPEAEPVDDLTVLRAQAEKLGIVVDGRWGARRLQSAIEEATAEAE